MLKSIEKTAIMKLAEKYEIEEQVVLDLLEEGFNLEEAEEIIYHAEY